MKAWQLPISGQDREHRERRAHFFLSSPAKDKLVRAECGTNFNPGFALPSAKSDMRCALCVRRLYEQLLIKQAA